MARTDPKNCQVTRLAAAWSRCARARRRPLDAHCRLGRAFQTALDTLGYGDKEDLLFDVLRAVRRAHPACTRSHLQNTLYRSARFARCCDADPHLLPRLERAGFRWWAVCEILSLLVRRLEAPKRDRQAISKVINHGLGEAARGRCTTGELVAELKRWRGRHPGYFRGRWNNAGLRAAHTRALRALEEIEDAGSVLFHHARGGPAPRSKAFFKAVAAARAQLNSAPNLPPGST